MPSDYGIWQNENECYFPSGPESERHDPEEFVERTKVRPTMLTFWNCELLAEGKVLQHQAAATAKRANDGSAAKPKQVERGRQITAQGILSYVPMLLNSKVDGM